jgi:hypothetical protein
MRNPLRIPHPRSGVPRLPPLEYPWLVDRGPFVVDAGHGLRAGLPVLRVSGSESQGHLLRAQWRWPVGMALCRPMGNGLWEVRTDLPTKRTARVLLCLYREHLVALHGFIKKTRATPDEDLATARRRQKELER